jgi:transcriptional regulator with XRE-family HTH domain
MGEVHIKLGKVLQLERQRRQFDLSDLADELKISLTNLEAIERGDVEALPSELYFNLFAKSYAERLGIDFTRTVEAIKDDVGEDVPAGSVPENQGEQKAKAGKKKSRSEDEDEIEAAESRLGKKLLWIAGAVVVVFVIFLGVSAIFYGDRGLNSGLLTEGEGPGVESGSAAAATAEYANYKWNSPDYAAPEPLTLILVAREESWATVFADGDTAIYRNLIPWREYPVQADYRLVVSIGIPSRVQVKLDGQEVNLVDPSTRRISRVEINQVNVQAFLDGTYYPEPVVTDESSATETPVNDQPADDST